MKRKNFAGWLVISLLPLLAFILMALQQHRALTVRAPIAASQFSADLASTVSYGFVEQPGGDALGGTLGSDAVVTDHAPATEHQPTVLERSTGLGSSVVGLQKS